MNLTKQAGCPKCQNLTCVCSREFFLMQKPHTDGTKPSDFFINSLNHPGKYYHQHIHTIDIRAWQEMKEAFDETFKNYQDLGKEMHEGMSKLEAKLAAAKTAMENANRHHYKCVGSTSRILDEAIERLND